MIKQYSICDKFSKRSFEMYFWSLEKSAFSNNSSTIEMLILTFEKLFNQFVQLCSIFYSSTASSFLVNTLETNFFSLGHETSEDFPAQTTAWRLMNKSCFDSICINWLAGSAVLICVQCLQQTTALRSVFWGENNPGMCLWMRENSSFAASFELVCSLTVFFVAFAACSWWLNKNINNLQERIEIVSFFEKKNPAPQLFSWMT